MPGSSRNGTRLRECSLTDLSLTCLEDPEVKPRASKAAENDADSRNHSARLWKIFKSDQAEWQLPIVRRPPASHRRPPRAISEMMKQPV